MSVLVEFLVELVLQFLVEALGEGLAQVLRTRIGRLVMSAVVGFGGGAVWGSVLRDRGQETLPHTLWVSLAFAVAGLFAAVALRGTARDVGDDPERAFGGLLPWRWSPRQWEGFALLNVFVALGVAVGFGLL